MSGAKNVVMPQTAAATQPAAGMVKIQAQTMFLATPQRTAEKPLSEPTPMMAPVTVCVVETGIPKRVANASDSALAVSEQNPLTGFSFVIFMPMVLTIRHPPKHVPIAMTKLQVMTTHAGT